MLMPSELTQSLNPSKLNVYFNNKINIEQYIFISKFNTKMYKNDEIRPSLGTSDGGKF